jgi:hypothetical protein
MRLGLLPICIKTCPFDGKGVLFSNSRATDNKSHELLAQLYDNRADMKCKARLVSNLFQKFSQKDLLL